MKKVLRQDYIIKLVTPADYIMCRTAGTRRGEPPRSLGCQHPCQGGTDLLREHDEKRREEQKEKEIETRKRRRVDDVSSITGG